MKIALLIPTHKPSDFILPFLSSFSEDDFDYFVVIDDGSGSKYKTIFTEIPIKTPFKVISFAARKGKGHALKTGVEDILSNCPDIEGIVTADVNGKYLKNDILTVRDSLTKHHDKLILGSRGLTSGISKTDRMAADYFYLREGKYINDPLSGLRGIPKNLFNMAKWTKGEKSEYEMNFLINASRVAGIIETSISTNRDDSVSKTRNIGIYKEPLVFLLAILLGFGIDNLVFWLFSSHVFVFENTLDVLWSSSASSLAVSLLSFIAIMEVGVLTKPIDLWKKTLFYLGVALVYGGTSFGISYWLSPHFSIWLGHLIGSGCLLVVFWLFWIILSIPRVIHLKKFRK